MTNPSEEIRKLMDRLASLPDESPSKAPQTLNEGIFDGIRGIMQRGAGRKEREEMIRLLQGEWNTWLGKTDRKGSIDDMELFIRKVLNWGQADIDTVLGTNDVEEPAAPDSTDATTTIPPTPEEPAAEPEVTSAPEIDPEEGRPIPTDPNAKLSDYGAVGDEAKEFHGSAGTYKNEDGSWNEELITKKLNALGDGMALVLGDTKFELQDDGHPEVVQNESIINELSQSKLSKAELKTIFGNIVSHHIEHYQGRRRRTGSSTGYGAAGSGSTGYGGYGGYGDADRSSRRTNRGGGYDLNRMWRILQADGLDNQSVKDVMARIAASANYDGMSNNDVELMSKIGYAFLKSGL